MTILCFQIVYLLFISNKLPYSKHGAYSSMYVISQMMAQPWWLENVSHSLDGAFPVKAKTSLSMVPQSVPISFMISSYSD